jgi:hypothetical protein
MKNEDISLELLLLKDLLAHEVIGLDLYEKAALEISRNVSPFDPEQIPDSAA